MGLPGPSKPARFEPLEWPIEIDNPDEPPVEEPAPEKEPATPAPEKEPVPA